MSTSMPDVLHSVPRGTNCVCGAPVEVLKTDQCKRCYKKDHPSKAYYHVMREKYPDRAAYCQRKEHKKCSGWRGRGSEERCGCECHLGICPSCHHVSDGKADARLRMAALKIKQIARELESGLSQ